MPAPSRRHGPTRGSRRRFFEQLEDRRLMAAGPEFVTNLADDRAPNYGVYKFLPAGDEVVFVNHDTATGYELWTTDGTPEGTHLVKDAAAGTRLGLMGVPEWLKIAPGSTQTYFATEDGQLWIIDLTTAGTRRVDTPTKASRVASFGDRVAISITDTIFGSATGRKPAPFSSPKTTTRGR